MVYVNGSPLCNPVRGIERYMREIVTRLDFLFSDKEIDITVLYPRGRLLFPPNLQKLHLKEMPSLDKKMFMFELLLNYWAKKGILCSFSNMVCLRKRTIVCIHDMRPWLFKYDRMRYRIIYSISVLTAKLFANKIMTDSQTALREIHLNAKIQLNRFQVVHCGWEHMSEIIADEAIFCKFPQIHKKNYYYSLSSQAPHKNFIWVLEVAKRNPYNIFVIAGDKWRHYDGTITMKDNVIYLGYITDGENKALLQSCKAFLHPSKYEGFGITPLEALACKAKICISNSSCLPEIFKDYAHYFDPDDFSVDLDKLLQEPLKSPDELLREYTWEKAARQWFTVICDAIDFTND